MSAQRTVAPATQPEHAGPAARDADVSRLAVFKRAVRESMNDHITNFAAALAYYAFLAIPSALLIAVGIFGLVASPQDVASLVEKLGGIVPGQVQTLLTGSLNRM